MRRKMNSILCAKDMYKTWARFSLFIYERVLVAKTRELYCKLSPRSLSLFLSLSISFQHPHLLRSFVSLLCFMPATIFRLFPFPTSTLSFIMFGIPFMNFTRLYGKVRQWKAARFSVWKKQTLTVTYPHRHTHLNLNEGKKDGEHVNVCVYVKWWWPEMLRPLWNGEAYNTHNNNDRAIKTTTTILNVSERLATKNDEQNTTMK